MKKLFLFAALAAALLAGCSKEPAAEQMPGATRLSLTLDGGAIAVQGTRVVDESAVSNLWVLQFDASGAQLTRQYISSIANPASIVLTTALSATANSTLYLVANTGNSSLFSTQTLAQAKAMTDGITTTTGAGIPTNTSTTLPMVGQSAALTFPVTAAIPVNLTRVVAKVTLTVKNLLTTGYPLLTVTSTQLKNVPKSYPTQVVDVANGFTGTTYYPATGASNFTNYTAVAGNITASGTTKTYYLAPNVRGVSTNSVSHLKSDAMAVSGQGDYCTYVEVLGTAKASADAPVVNVRYRLYLGGNNTNDFNLQSNTAYTVDIELAGLYASDARLTITTDKFNLSQGTTDGDHAGDAGDGWRSPAIGDLKDGGILYWADPADPALYKVFSLDGSSLAWAAQNGYEIGPGAQSRTDGKGNVAAMKYYSRANINNGDDTKKTTGVFATDFPAAAFCDAKNTGGVTGWYLPAKEELEALDQAYNTNKDVLEKAITDNKGTYIPANSHWSSTEASPSEAWYVLLSHNYSAVKAKSVPYTVRCVKSTVPSPLPAIGDPREGGIVYWVDPADATKYKVFSLDEGISCWSAKNTYVLYASGQSATDGKGNVAAMKAYSTANTGNTDATKKTTGVFATDFPAAEFCDRKNTGGVTGWYLPALDELKAFYNTYTANKDVLDKAITDNRGTDMGSVFWSSTEYNSNTSYAWYVTFSDGSAGGDGKNKGGWVRCVRDL